jgi:hypothetical protein
MIITKLLSKSIHSFFIEIIFFQFDLKTSKLPPSKGVYIYKIQTVLSCIEKFHFVKEVLISFYVFYRQQL